VNSADLPKLISRNMAGFGCPQCYQTFSGVIEPMLGSDAQRERPTLARCPLRALNRRSLSERLSKLEGELDEAIKAERYEDAARFRDEILQVKQAFDPKPAGGR
jgi:protein arginine kinase activator